MSTVPPKYPPPFEVVPIYNPINFVDTAEALVLGSGSGSGGSTVFGNIWQTVLSVWVDPASGGNVTNVTGSGTHYNILSSGTTTTNINASTTGATFDATTGTFTPGQTAFYMFMINIEMFNVGSSNTNGKIIITGGNAISPIDLDVKNMSFVANDVNNCHMITTPVLQVNSGSAVNFYVAVDGSSVDTVGFYLGFVTVFQIS